MARKSGFLLVLPSLLLGLALAETAFRGAIMLGLIDFPAPRLDKIVHRYADNPALVYELKPSFRVATKGVRVRTNAWGMRDDEYPQIKPEGATRIAVIGDSITFGHTLPSYQQTYPKLLEARLNYSGSGSFEVLNMAVVGYNSAQEEIVLKEKVSKFKPDTIIVGFCLNDDTYTDGLGMLARETAPWSLGSRLHSRLFSYFAHKYERIYFAARTDWGKVRSFFQALSAYRDQNKSAVLVLVFPYLFEDAAGYEQKPKHALLKAMAQEHRLTLMDYLDEWASIQAPERRRLYLPADDTHFSEYGMKIITDSLAAALLPETAAAAAAEAISLSGCTTILGEASGPGADLRCAPGAAVVARAMGSKAAITCCPVQVQGAFTAGAAQYYLPRERACGNGEIMTGLSTAHPSMLLCAKLNLETLEVGPGARAFYLSEDTAWLPRLLDIAKEYAAASCICPLNAAMSGGRSLDQTDCGDKCLRLKERRAPPFSR
jgi:lysophospholipase L1-like esterase